MEVSWRWSDYEEKGEEFREFKLDNPGEGPGRIGEVNPKKCLSPGRGR